MFLISEPGGEGQAEHAAEHVSVTRVAQRLEQAVPLLQQDPFLIMALSLDTVESRLLIRRNLHQNRAIFECAVECQRKNNFTDSLFPSCHHFGPRRANTSHYRSLVLCSYQGHLHNIKGDWVPGTVPAEFLAGVEGCLEPCVPLFLSGHLHYCYVIGGTGTCGMSRRGRRLSRAVWSSVPARATFITTSFSPGSRS